MREDTKKRFHALELTLTRLFERRPLWQRRSLDRLEELQSTSANLLSNTLTLFAYNYVSGPFKGLLVRLGYDPSHHPVARFYQVYLVGVVDVDGGVGVGVGVDRCFLIPLITVSHSFPFPSSCLLAFSPLIPSPSSLLVAPSLIPFPFLSSCFPLLPLFSTESQCTFFCSRI